MTLHGEDMHTQDHDASANSPVRTVPVDTAVPSRASLASLRETGVLSSAAWEAAVERCGFIPNVREWLAYWRHILLLGGALFLAAGIIFFIAWNWSGMHPFARMALVGFVVAATGVGAVWRGPDTASGRALLLTSGICVGPLLAVFGQTYQTGAELWELFRVWTVILFALAVLGKQAGLWLTTWLAANVFVMLWLGRTFGNPLEALGMFSLLPECLIALALAVTAWEWAADRSRRNGAGQDWLRSRWLPRLLFFDLTVRMTVYLCLTILPMRWWLDHLTVYFLPHSPVIPVLALAVAGVSWYWHRKRTPDLFMFACLVAACATLIVAVLVRAEFAFEAEVWALFIWGLVIVGLTAGAAKILLALQRQMNAGKGTAPPAFAGGAIMEFFAPTRPVPGWDALWAFLRQRDPAAFDAPVPELRVENSGPASPWYIRFLLAAGGWIAAVLFVSFLALFLFLTLRIRGDEGMVLFTASWVPLGVAFVCLKRDGNFIRHFGFSLALAGSIAACVGLGLALDGRPVFLFCCAALLAGLCVIMRSAAYRFLAALVLVQLVVAGMIATPLYGRGFRRSSGEEWITIYRIALYGTAVLWAAVCCGISRFHLDAGNRCGGPLRNILEPASHGLYGGAMCYLILVLAMRMGDPALFSLGGGIYLPSGAFAVGLGAGAGVLYLAWRLAQGVNNPAERGLVLGCAALCPPLGWFLPGVALAAFGLTLSRYLGSLVMQGATAAFLFAYMVYYYYFLGIPLLHKSLLLAGTGVVLLVLAAALRRFGPCGETDASGEGGHA